MWKSLRWYHNSRRHGKKPLMRRHLLRSCRAFSNHTNSCSVSAPTTIVALEDCLSEPAQSTIDCLGRLLGDILVLGAGGKMGPSLTRMARRASDAAGMNRRVIAVSRFSDAEAKSSLEEIGVETIQGDLMDERFVSSLPVCENVIFMVGLKFGTSGGEARTWATNAYLPGVVCRKFSRSRIVAFSTGNVYGLVSVDSGNGSLESDALRPAGEYAMSCLGRERVFEYFSRETNTPVTIMRLNYAAELRYGVLVDLAQRVHREEPISLTMGYFNVIWQTDANRMALCCLEQATSPPSCVNVTGLERVSCRAACDRFGKLMHKCVRYEGAESETALLSNAQRAGELFGPPQVSLDDMIDWTADWISSGGKTWNKPTHFESRDGKF